jgi:hypothetical protein
MRKILSALILCSLLVPTLILAQAAAPTEITKCVMRHTIGADYIGFTCPASGVDCLFSDATKTCGSCCMLDTIFTITDWIFYLVVSVALIFIILGAFSIITAGGSPEKVTAGRNYIIYAVIGLIIGLAARAIPSLAKAILGMG